MLSAAGGGNIQPFTPGSRFPNTTSVGPATLNISKAVVINTERIEQFDQISSLCRRIPFNNNFLLCGLDKVAVLEFKAPELASIKDIQVYKDLPCNCTSNFSDIRCA